MYMHVNDVVIFYNKGDHSNTVVAKIVHMLLLW